MLRLGLLLSTVGWGISFYFTFTTWEVATDQLYMMGADPIEYQPLLNYWLKMASATLGCIGIASAMACARPAVFEGLIWLLGPFHGVIGAVLVAAAVSNDLRVESHPTFPADITFCFVTCFLISVPLFVGMKQNRNKRVA